MFEIFLHFHSESKINIILCTSDCEIIISEVWIIKCTKISHTCYNCLKFLSKFRVCDNKINICTSFSEKGSLTSVSRSTLTGGSLETFSKQSKKKKKNGAMIVNNQSLNYYKSLNLVIANWPFPQEDFSESKKKATKISKQT